MFDRIRKVFRRPAKRAPLTDEQMREKLTANRDASAGTTRTGNANAYSSKRATGERWG